MWSHFVEHTCRLPTIESVWSSFKQTSAYADAYDLWQLSILYLRIGVLPASRLSSTETGRQSHRRVVAVFWRRPWGRASVRVFKEYVSELTAPKMRCHRLAHIQIGKSFCWKRETVCWYFKAPTLETLLFMVLSELSRVLRANVREPRANSG